MHAFGFFRRAAWLLVMVFPLLAGAQAWPGKPIKWIIPYPPGGITDSATRMVVQKVQEQTGWNIVVENKPGANSILGAELAARAAPDGNTLLVFSSIFWTAPLLEKTPYDTVKDFAPVTLAANAPNVLVAHPSLAANSVRELVALAKASPGVINYASGPTGSSLHFAGELFKSMAGVNLTRIPYKSEGPALNDMISGQVQVMFATAAGGLPHVKSKRLKALAMTTAQRSTIMPELPTISESGVPGYESVSIIGIYAPAATPQPVLDRLNQEFVKVLNAADVREKLFNVSLEVIASSRAQSSATMTTEIARLGKVIQDAGIKAD